jgi:hypothetical protein
LINFKFVNGYFGFLDDFSRPEVHVDNNTVPLKAPKNKGVFEISLRIAGHQCAAAPPHNFHHMDLAMCFASRVRPCVHREKSQGGAAALPYRAL